MHDDEKTLINEKQSFISETVILVRPVARLYTLRMIVKVENWHLGIFNFILKLRLYKLNTFSLLSTATANSKMVYC